MKMLLTAPCCLIVGAIALTAAGSLPVRIAVHPGNKSIRAGSSVDVAIELS
jgi:hypothetical protein